MNAEIKEEWVAALRSGKYSQTEGSLRDEIGYCCLGVLCELLEARGIGHYDGDNNYWFENKHEKNMPPTAIRDYLGLDSWKINYEGEIKSLDSLNDDGKRFEEIANAIEQSDL